MEGERGGSGEEMGRTCKQLREWQKSSKQTKVDKRF